MSQNTSALFGKNVELGDICELIVDCEHKTAPRQDTGHPSIRTPNIGRGFFILDNVYRVSDETYRTWTRRAVPLPGDLIMAREAPVGNVAIIPEGLEPCLGQRTLLIRCDRSKADPAFLNYLLNGPVVQSTIHGMTNGATVAHLNMEDVRSLPIPELPPLPIQHRIGSILGSYDDLIENNLRRIKILEEMAQSLYREWFVNFRFPGHKKHGPRPASNDACKPARPNTPGWHHSPLGPIPTGWEIRTLGEVVDEAGGTIRTGPFGSQLHQSDYQQEGVPVVMPKDIIAGRVSEDGIARIGEGDVERLAQHCLLEGDIVYGRRGDIGRHALIGVRETGWLCGTGCLRISLGNAPLTPLFLHYYLDQENVVGWIKNHAIGATMPNLNTNILRAVEVLCPPRHLVDRFTEVVRGMEGATRNLSARNTNLRHTRDFLLPKLISGEVAVAGADADAEDVAVAKAAEAPAVYYAKKTGVRNA